MGDITKLPKWAQKHIADLQSIQNVTGANVSGCHIEMNAVKHDEHSAAAITSIAHALEENAKSLGILAQTIVPKNVSPTFGPGIHLSDVKGK